MHMAGAFKRERANGVVAVQVGIETYVAEQAIGRDRVFCGQYTKQPAAPYRPQAEARATIVRRQPSMNRKALANSLWISTAPAVRQLAGPRLRSSQSHEEPRCPDELHENAVHFARPA